MTFISTYATLYLVLFIQVQTSPAKTKIQEKNNCSTAAATTCMYSSYAKWSALGTRFNIFIYIYIIYTCTPVYTLWKASFRGIIHRSLTIRIQNRPNDGELLPTGYSKLLVCTYTRRI